MMLLALMGLLGQVRAHSVVCLGDSLTLRYAAALTPELAKGGAIVNTYATPGAFVAEADVRKTLDASADVVLLGIGTDAAADKGWLAARDHFVPDVERLILRLKAGAFHPKVLLCLPPEAVLPVSDVRRGYLNNQVLPLLRQAARETDCPTIGFDDALRDRPDLMDGLMPSDLGVEMLADTVADSISNGRKADWKLVYADSEETDEGPAKNAIDGDPDTYWHTNYSTTQEKYPHEIQVDMGSERTIGGFSYLPRQDGGTNGRVAKYEFYVSLDGKAWGKPVATGAFRRGAELSKVFFDHAVQCRFFRFRALSEESGQMWASAAELDVLKFYPKRP